MKAAFGMTPDDTGIRQLFRNSLFPVFWSFFTHFYALRSGDPPMPGVSGRLCFYLVFRFSADSMTLADTVVLYDPHTRARGFTWGIEEDGVSRRQRCQPGLIFAPTIAHARCASAPIAGASGSR